RRAKSLRDRLKHSPRFLPRGPPARRPAHHRGVAHAAARPDPSPRRGAGETRAGRSSAPRPRSPAGGPDGRRDPVPPGLVGEVHVGDRTRQVEAGRGPLSPGERASLDLARQLVVAAALLWPVELAEDAPARGGDPTGEGLAVAGDVRAVARAVHAAAASRARADPASFGPRGRA